MIDFGEGRSWLTTRLFIFAILLRRMGSVRTFVFLETREGVNRRYLGVRPPDAVHWLLARAYPWMERAFAESYCGLPELDIIGESGALQTSITANLVETFIQNPDITASNRDDDQENWLQMSPGRWEHARWMHGAMASELFNLSLATTSFVGLGDDRKAENTFAELAGEGPFVALLDERHRFRTLLDREALLEKLAVEMSLKFALVLAYGQAEGEERPATGVMQAKAR